MRKFNFYALSVIAALFVLTACDKEKETTDVSVTGVTLEPSTLTLLIDGTQTLVATVLPENATDKTVTWESSMPNIASVENGLVTALATGEAVITVKTKNGNKTATCTVTVVETVVPVESVSLDEEEMEIYIGDEFTLTATVLPEAASNKAVTWESSAPDVATVVDGVVTGIADGEATITVTTVDGEKEKSCVVTVLPEIDVLSKITDEAFLAYCQGKMTEWDTDGNGELSRAEASAVERIEMERDRYYTGAKVASFAGIEHFKNLYYLFCGWNALTELDLSKNTHLIELTCSNNQIATIDVSACAELLTMDCSINPVGELDVTGCTALKELKCNNVYNSRTLTSLDASGCTALELLQCNNNFALSSLDVTGCAALNELSVFNAYVLASLDLSGFENLTYLDASYIYAMPSLDLSGCEALTYLDLSFCEALETLNISDCTALATLACGYCKLASLDISKNPALNSFDCGGNPGNGVDSFPVTAWFDNTAIPIGFTRGSWAYGGGWIDDYTYVDPTNIFIAYENVVD